MNLYKIQTSSKLNPFYYVTAESFSEAEIKFKNKIDETLLIIQEIASGNNDVFSVCSFHSN